MLSISPQSAEIVAAVPTAASIFALPGWRCDEKPAKVEVERARGTLRAEDIPFYDDGPPVLYPYVVVKRFEHVPTIMYRCGDQTVVVTGPIQPTIPHTTEATRPGWEKVRQRPRTRREGRRGGCRQGQEIFSGPRRQGRGRVPSQVRARDCQGQAGAGAAQIRSAAGLDELRQGSGVRR
jgi:hypothetical protein